MSDAGILVSMHRKIPEVAQEWTDKMDVHILLIEDEPVIRRELKILLENALYRVSTAESMEKPAAEVLELRPDLVLLDLNLPGKSGFDICTEIRTVSEVPIIFVTGRSDSMDELTGLMRGGDDYITKPFQPAVLLAHIAAVLKRTVQKEKEQIRISHRGVELDVAKGSIYFQGQSAELTKSELKILHCLFLNAGKIVSRADLTDTLWDSQIFIDDNTLSVHVTRIRGKLEQLGVKNFIGTKRGLGYYI